ncbi:Zn(II)2Cys6 transcription factor domain-containing protein [Aspergillus novofumigatus IBT 16806]|uniref:Putative C6 finger domain protein n=1 Tax=Aspergillus novofumigatus (strain IBT 16806) TaxID=1392255 RepID=A0A2I1BXI4_ASPN1|nr:putative C6 finger domain protein [Aspergillus novofumigatus IBT 16806]PKX90090.1 putative C6 finger domain protein [Aspergillus novofumigatus IBT 16806]
MSLRKTSCRACVAAKRRCDHGVPSCSRCCKKSITCRYPYPPPPAKGDQTAPLDVHVGSSLEIDPTGSSTCELAPVEDSIQPSMISDRRDDIVNPTWFLEGPMTSSQAWNFSQGASGWRPLPSSADGFTSALLRLERRVLEFWPRAQDTETWGFCVRTFIGYVDHFLDTGTMPLIGSLADRTSDLPPLLREAYGVCAAYRASKNAKKPFYHQLLNAAVNNMSRSISAHTDLQRQLDRIQALVLYYIIFLAGGITNKPLLRQLDRMLAQGTADLERMELSSRQATRYKTQLDSHFSESHLNGWVLCESARRLVMISYLVRAVHSVIQFQRCNYIKYLAGLPVSTKSYAELCWEEFIYEREQSPGQSISGVISYDEFVSDWEQGGLVQVDEFRHLLLVACKGLGSVRERTSKELVPTFDPLHA